MGSKSDPWLNIPLDEYEGHMNAPEVGQLTALSELFQKALADTRPASVAVLGIAGGNGLEYVDPCVTTRVLGIDIHPDYLETVRQRHGGRLTLQLSCLDLAQESLHLEPVQLVHAALIFEHAGISRCLENAAALVAPGGTLSVVLQLPSESSPNIAASPFTSIHALAGHFALVDSMQFRSAVERFGFRLRSQIQRPLPAGKAFWMGVFSRI